MNKNTLDKTDIGITLPYGDARLGYKPSFGYTIIYARFLDLISKEIYIGKTKQTLNERASNGTGYFNTGLRQVVGINGMKGILTRILDIVPNELANKAEHDTIVKLKSEGWNVYNLNDGSEYVKQKNHRSLNNFRCQGVNKAIVDVNNNGVCIFDKEDYMNYYADKYLAPAQSPTYNKHGFGVSQGGYISFTNEEGKHTTVAHDLPKRILGKHYDEMPRCRTVFLDGDKRNYSKSNISYNGKTLETWQQIFQD